MNTNGSSDHDNQNFFDRLNQTVGLWIIRSRAVMAQTKLACKFSHHGVSKMAPMVSNNCLWDTEPSYYMIEYENCSCFAACVECRHRLGLFSKIINREDDMRMPPSRVRVASNKVDTPFGEWTNGNYRVERSRWCAHLAIKHLTVVAFPKCNNTVFKQGGPEIASAQYLLGCGIPRHMTATCSRVTVIQHPFSFLMS